MVFSQCVRKMTSEICAWEKTGKVTNATEQAVKAVAERSKNNEKYAVKWLSCKRIVVQSRKIFGGQGKFSFVISYLRNGVLKPNFSHFINGTNSFLIYCKRYKVPCRPWTFWFSFKIPERLSFVKKRFSFWQPFSVHMFFNRFMIAQK